VVVAGKGKSAGNILYALDTYNSEDWRSIQTACVIDETPFASNNSSFGGGVKIRVVGFALVGSAGKIKSQFFSRSGGEE
jgi:hypothetical protein